MPRGALGVADPAVKVLDPKTGAERAPARFDAHGRLSNAEEAIGELVNTAGASMFEGYYNNDEANAKRMRDGRFWSGDLAYKDEKGFLYFAGRDVDWLRVDGENFAAAPLERILTRYPGVVLAAVYAVPDADVGDQVMAALELKDPAAFDPDAFDAFLAGQEDLGTKSTPRYVRISASLPITRTSKVLKRQLRAEAWECNEPIFSREKNGAALRLLSPEATANLRKEFEARGRAHLLP
jgi:fatty-acyl-CoA synthase